MIIVVQVAYHFQIFGLSGVVWLQITEIKTNTRITSKNPIQNVEKHGKTIQKVKNRKSETYKQYKRYLIHTKNQLKMNGLLEMGADHY